jgi:hypothetical protein
LDPYQHVSSGGKELLPDSPTLVGDVPLRQFLHVPDGLNEELVAIVMKLFTAVSYGFS